MPLPKQVIEAGRRAEEAEKKFREKQGLGPDGEVITPPPDTEVIDDPEKAAAATPNGEEVIPPVIDDKTVLDWEQEYKTLLAENGRLKASYNTLQGKYNAEIPRHIEENKRLQAVIDDTSKSTPTDAGSESGIDDSLADIEETYGSELTDGFKKQARCYQTQIDQLKAELGKVSTATQDAAETTQEDAKRAFYKKITDVHPDWEVIDNTKAFDNFLGEVSEDTGLPRQESIENAFRTGNPEPIILQLDIFKKRTKAGKGKERQVVPDDSGGAVVVEGAGDEKRYNQSTVTEFYKAAALKVSKGELSTKEYNRLDRLYSEAAKEGRINVDR